MATVSTSAALNSQLIHKAARGSMCASKGGLGVSVTSTEV